MSIASPLYSPAVLELGRCSGCGGTLAQADNAFGCSTCSRSWPVIGGVLCGNPDLRSRFSRAVNGDSLEDRIFQRFFEEFKLGNEPVEDERSAEWRLFLEAARVGVILGAGSGSIPIALAHLCEMLFVAEGDAGKVSFLADRVAEARLNNVVPSLGGLEDLPVVNGGVDLCIAPYSPVQLETVKRMCALVRPGGTIVLLIRPSRFEEIRACLGGPAAVRTIVPIPSGRRIPQFLIPSESEQQASGLVFGSLLPMTLIGGPKGLKGAAAWAAARMVSWRYVSRLAGKVTFRKSTSVLLMARTAGTR